MTQTLSSAPNAAGRQGGSRVLTSLPPFPAVAQRLLALVSRDDCPIPEVNQLVRSDAVFSAEILQLANSAILASRYQVTSVLHAISVLGLARIRSLVITLAMRDMLRAARQNQFLQEAWRHNFATGLACEALAQPCRYDRAIAYTAGLLHELGRLALVSSFGARYLSMLDIAARKGIDAEAMEREILGLDHLDAGRMLCDLWNLPECLAAAVCHRRPPVGEPFGTAHLVAAGCVLAEHAGFALTPRSAGWDPEAVVALLPAADSAAVRACVAELEETIPMAVARFEREFLAGRFSG